MRYQGLACFTVVCCLVTTACSSQAGSPPLADNGMKNQPDPSEPSAIDKPAPATGKQTKGKESRSANSEPQTTRVEERADALSDAQEAEIRDLVEQLVFADYKATNRPVIAPGISDDSDAYRKRFEICQQAFQKLSNYKALAFPILLEHLDDDRQSINFRNHYVNNSVGDACFWIVYYQLTDQPEDYSRYGYSRKGRDGKDHPKPYWEGTPFDDAGGLREWLDENKELSYVEMQIKCLRWLLDKEKEIGAADADSYFLNILPLEIRILQRRKENGEQVEPELQRLVRIRDEKLTEEIPLELLPDR